MAAALFRLEKSRDLADFRQQVAWMAAGPELNDGLRASVYTWLTKVLLPAKFPGIDIAEARSLEEVKTMLAERAMEWTRQWKEEGRQEGLREVGLQVIKDFLLSEMAERFGAVPEAVRLQVEGIQDLEELKSLARKLRVVDSLDDLQC